MKVKIRIEYTPAGVVCRVRRLRKLFPYGTAFNGGTYSNDGELAMAWGKAQLEAELRGVSE